MELHTLIILAFVMDLLIGDPPGYQHPVRIIGYTAGKMESLTRRWFANATMAGAMTTIIVAANTLLISWALLELAGLLHPIAKDACTVLLIYTALSVRSLFDESRPVLEQIKMGQDELAKKSLAKIVGRDTGNLDQQGILRATVETIAEGIVDGIIAPLFYAFLGGAPLALTYKAINTLDSMFGYKNETYRRFGLVPARLDDAANWLPARIAAPIIALGSWLCGLNGKGSLTTAFRDGQNHLSPNAGIPEAAVAGALGIQLGGTSFYEGVRIDKPLIGARRKEIDINDINKSHRIMFVSSGLALLVFILTGKIFSIP